MTGAELSAAFAAAGAAGWGHVAYERLLPAMSREARERVEALCPGAQSVLVAAFPYYAGRTPGNLSLYARGRDYHLVITEALTTICHMLEEKYGSYRFVPGADNSPLPEREAARLAGLGMIGRHGLVILPPYGSWIFLGTILTDLDLSLPPALPSGGCMACGKCLSACPGGALRGDSFDPERCLSHLTQKKGALPPEQEALVAAHPLIWGCDVCQLVCPHNAGAVETPLAPFREDRLDSLTSEAVEGLTNRQFREAYGERAFAWRGPAVLRRNLALQKKK
ncbi:QueG-associated DUF1730 domain-containing protein [Clostridium sp. J1101437_171009_A5]|uniref:epoxyqueuosine reductase n=1 Tax=Clostridium sp. J1101437_171009_A5 TaxID=2787098 RepID=UPI00189A964E|nr:QueG-associated DUF1730 domain-containing protein [Clostridium sp. J1101437_171009_A5]